SIGGRLIRSRGISSVFGQTGPPGLSAWLLIVVWQPAVVRPRCTGPDSPNRFLRRGAPPMKLVFASIVVVREPCGILRIAAIAPRVSANAMIAPPCRLSPIVHNSLRTVIEATTFSGDA